ncbi:PREDICTED: acyl-CoA synthetase family member 3, mitochondrial-like [Thamnophis sirtalis]|uniref:Acyl-CoA synthetase family member 3, mitochondrial-like n=1 Tax=Thamnophis sirtalis TaxID=35019 RepID=A0A6I9XGX0_9SAUR|nr:PREDICTED: acyl-CoA synthetase family member 3, mitochondrial-like [Thamnophis sirtalis]
MRFVTLLLQTREELRLYEVIPRISSEQLVKPLSPFQVWEALLSLQAPRVNVFMAVPTIYSKLIAYHEEHFSQPRVQDFIRAICQDHIREMNNSWPVNASLGLITTLIGGLDQRWLIAPTEEAPWIVDSKRSVGTPLPGVKVRIATGSWTKDDSAFCIHAEGDEMGTTVTPGFDAKEGELFVKGPAVFREYWNRPAETKDAFTPDGWFKTDRLSD